MIRERTHSGLVAARANGCVGGRKPKLTADQRREAITMIGSDHKSAADANVARPLKSILQTCRGRSLEWRAQMEPERKSRAELAK
jgi:DNA invertase Pin-like site-specific DNA recombinase